MAGWEDDDLDEIIDQALTAAPHENISSSKSREEVETKAKDRHGWSEDEIASEPEIEQDVPIVHDFFEQNDFNSQCPGGWLEKDVDLKLELCEETAKPIITEPTSNPMVQSGWSDDELDVAEIKLDVTQSVPSACTLLDSGDNSKAGSIENSEPVQLDPSRSMDGWGADDLDIKEDQFGLRMEHSPLKVDLEPVSVEEKLVSIGEKLTAPIKAGWEDDELDLDISGNFTHMNHDNVKDNDLVANTGIVAVKKDDGIVLPVNSSAKKDGATKTETTDEPVLALKLDQNVEIRPQVHTGWVDDELDLDIDLFGAQKNREENINIHECTLEKEDSNTELPRMSAENNEEDSVIQVKNDDNTNSEVNLYVHTGREEDELDINKSIVTEAVIPSTEKVAAPDCNHEEDDDDVGEYTNPKLDETVSRKTDSDEDRSSSESSSSIACDNGVPDSPFPTSEKAPSGWQNDDFELDFSLTTNCEEQILAAATEIAITAEPESSLDSSTAGYESKLLEPCGGSFDIDKDRMAIAIEQGEDAEIQLAQVVGREEDLHATEQDEPPKMTAHPSVSMGWLDEDLDIPDFPSMDPLSVERDNNVSRGLDSNSGVNSVEPAAAIDKIKENLGLGNQTPEERTEALLNDPSQVPFISGIDVNEEVDRSHDKILVEKVAVPSEGSESDPDDEDEIPKRSLYDEFPTEPNIGWDDGELELPNGEDNGWATDNIILAAETSSKEGKDDVSPEDFAGAYQNSTVAPVAPEDDIAPEDFYGDYQEAEPEANELEVSEEDQEEELTSPTQWFSGVLKTIGSDLKSKTVAGLDKLYEALDTVPESGTSSVPASEDSKFKGLLDQLSPKTTTVLEENQTNIPSDSESMSVTEGDDEADIPAGEKFKGLFDTIRPVADDGLGRMMGKIGQTTLSLASHTKNTLTPAMQDFASRVKKKITEMPKRRLKREDLDADVRRLLFREPEAMEALESIQIAACRNSIELKRMRKAGHTIAPLLRDDPTTKIGAPAAHLDTIEGWQSFESKCGVEFPLSHKVEMTRLLLLARNSADSMMEIYSSLDSAPESLDSDLYLAIRIFAYRQIIADFTRISLELLSFIISEAASEESVTTLIMTFLSELEHIRQLAQQPSEDIAFTFPEIGDDILTSSSSIISERLNIQPLLSIIREVYYAYEPIVAISSLK